MNELQTLFSALFGIFFATTVSITGKYDPFDTTAVVLGDRRALRRLLASVALLDLIPFAYFLLVFRLLGRKTESLHAVWGEAFGVLFGALAFFGFYRLFISVMLIRRGASKSDFALYSKAADVTDESAKKFVALRHLLKSAPEAEFIYPRHLLYGAGAWLVVCWLVFWLLTMCSL